MTEPLLNINGTDALNSIGENIIIADENFNIIWLNSRARKLFESIAPLYNLKNAEEVIGKSMDFFHDHPSHQRQIMAGLQDGHRARIYIKNTFVADIVISPIRSSQNENQDIEGYMVMLMDVTTQAEEEKKMKKRIRELSAPILNIWDKTIAITLVGELDMDRGETIIPAVLEECSSKGIEYVMLSFRGVKQFDESVRQTVVKLHDCLKLLGVQCIVVGIKPELAVSIGELKHISTFRDAHEGLKYIMKLQENLHK
ncbi:RsbR, positive regulator of sigma-B [Mesobacillus campisalis]|uniref:RsbR, positive regulator of sigma-B n=1 Tax=Mesobacillus campisalis TaxID=1408103 RepID=A0A0M2SX19_9BACI|nr:STAS domain-containing protein [Mesobacillus campisalis]KKK39109.1 RsbR, positive regulator of sigma-B [Mesobacillus campisalis]